MITEPRLIVQVPLGGKVDRQLPAQTLPRIAGGGGGAEAGPTDADGHLEAPGAGQVVLSLLSPEALEREADEVRRGIAHAGTGVEPLLVVVEGAEERRGGEMAALWAASSLASRAVILRIAGDA